MSPPWEGLDAFLQTVGASRLLDVVMAVLLIETAALLAWHRATGRGLGARVLLPSLAAGLFLMLALRIALSGGSAAWLSLALAAAGLSHAVDLRQRWPRRG